MPKKKKGVADGKLWLPARVSSLLLKCEQRKRCGRRENLAGMKCDTTFHLECGTAFLFSECLLFSPLYYLASAMSSFLSQELKFKMKNEKSV
jgi:hypothetical protein